jgi:hypothetical protein
MNARSVRNNGVLSALTRIRQLAGVFTMAAVLALAFSVSSTPVYAQSNAQGSIFGRVVGSSASDLTDATVTLSSKDINVSRTAPVSASGTFEFPALAVGDYEVTLNVKGREPVTQATHVGVATVSSVRFEPTEGAIKLEKFVVSGEDSSPVDVANTVIGLSVRSEMVNQLPVAQNITAVSLLAPGVVPGDRGFFGNLASFAGSSVGENAYYLNGFNITDFRRGLGYGNVPYEFFSEFNTLTSGYSAEFGRSTGGVVNAVSKRGTNNYHAKVGVVWEPADLGESGRDTYGSDGKAYVIRSLDTQEVRNYNFEASGPIWKNHLYFYGLYQSRKTTEDYMAPTTASSRAGINITQWNHRVSDDPFWAAKIDFQLTQNHALEYTTFSDRNDRLTTQYPYAWTSAAGSNSFTLPASKGTPSTLTSALGGRYSIYRYSGSFFDNVLTISALYGESTKNSSVLSSEADQPYIVDNRSSAGRLSGAASITEDVDLRKAKRVDGVLRFDAFGKHALKFGYDNENNKAHSLTRTSGDGTNYTYENYTGGALANGATPPPGTTQMAIISVYAAGGDFRVITEATYLEDNWKLLNDRLNLNLGVRQETFDNRNGNDKTFIKLENQRAPRLSGSYDLKGDGLSHVFGSYGRYFLQIPANTNVRMAGGETYYTDYFVLNSLQSNNLPNLGAQVGPRTVTGTGIVPGVETIIDSTIGPMYQDEFTLGYERALNSRWKASVKFIYRDLKQVLEDVAVDAALNKYAQSKGYSTFEAGGFDYYVLTNPGKDLTFYINMTKDFSGEDGVPDGIVDYHDQSEGISSKEKVTLGSAALGYPKATRKYYAVQLELERSYAEKWFGRFSYVWSQSYGNYEGSVYSDIGQTDAGITQLFDQPGLTDGSYGPQPNDRRHVFKAFGGYKVAKTLMLSGNFSLYSGRPINGLGLHPTDAYARVYGGSSYYVNGVLAPRGSFGRTPWVANLDLAARWKPSFGQDKLEFGVDVFNVLNRQSTTAVFERSVAGSTGTPLFFYHTDRSIQTPRYVRLTASYSY